MSSAAPVLFMHEASLQHDTGPHPERAERIRSIQRALDAGGAADWERAQSPRADREALLRVHPERHLDLVEGMALRGGGSIDADTTVSAGSWEAAVRAAGGGIAVVDALLDGRARAAASLQRPPGHHCEPDHPMGFCLLSNAAIAARHAVEARGLERVLVFDWDVHHGNGTQAVLWDDPSTLFCSIHQSPLYPGTGSPEETGGGAGPGLTVNLPVPSGSGDDVFCSLTAHVLAPLVAAFEPSLVLVSAGFDAHRADPLASCTVTDQGFAAMAAIVRGAAEGVGAPVGLLLEGGYDVDALARSVVGCLDVLGSDSPVPSVDVGLHPLAATAGERLSTNGSPLSS